MGSDKGTQTAVSPTLALAQEKLLRLRQALDASKLQGDALITGDLDQTPSKNHVNAKAQTCTEPGRSRRREKSTLGECVGQLPLHLGWESARVTAVLRQEQKSDACDVGREIRHRDNRTPAITHHASRITPPQERPTTIKVYPSVAQGILREGHAAAGRVWLLLRYLDENGRGWLTEADAQKQLTTKTSPTHLFGKRQWRNIIRKGTGIFWQRENGRLWLNSVSKTAAALGVWQLTGQPVQLPITALTGKIGTVRAHLYATFHSSRTDKTKAKPIARESLTAQFNISPRTQRSYERKARVKSHQNYAIGAKNASESAENTAWQHGTAAFPFTDYLGKHGRPGTSYLAWQLPNHYFGPHQQACRGQQKRINRELADLFMKGMTGNDNESVDGKETLTAEARRTQRKDSVTRQQLNIPRRFCDNGRFAAKVYNRNQAEQDVYWRSPGKNIWHVLEMKPEIGD